MYKHWVLLSGFFLLSIVSFSQKKSKRKKSKQSPIEVVALGFSVEKIKQHVNILASDSFQGRRTGTEGEQLAMSYIKNQFVENNISPKGTDGSYFQNFEISEGQEFESASFFKINGVQLKPVADYFPLNISANKAINDFVSPILKDLNTVWFLDLKNELKKNEKNPHYDITPFIEQKAVEYQQNGAVGMLIYNSSNKEDGLGFDPKAKKTSVEIPVIYLSKNITHQYLQSSSSALEVDFHIAIKDKKRNGSNVIGYIDNNADNTIIIGAHYDHLGMGEDKNSLYAGKEKMIHNGADDNASGVAALIELAAYFKKANFKKSNLLFIAFSGEELGLYGSKYFTENATIPLEQINFMINMDMIGRLNDSTKTFTIGGFGTSPTWEKVISSGITSNGVSIKLDSSGTGPSDHSSFYRKNIPVLFFFTGTHGDYHKPSDDAEKLNYQGEESILKTIVDIITKTSAYPKLAFTKTRENTSGGSSTRFTVSLGIMPDYTFSGKGVRADGVSEGKLAQKIGVLAGDIIVQIGEYEITSVETYMKVLSKYKKGDTTKLITTRSGKELQYEITF